MQAKEFDCVQAIARQLPMRMLGRIIGTPDEDLPWLVQKGDSLIANTDPDFTQHVLDKLEGDAYRMMPFRSPAGMELYDYAEKLMEKKRAAGDTSGVLNLIMQPDSAGNVLTDREFKNFFCLLVAAGNDTTRYSIVKAFHVLANRPDLVEALRAGEGNIWETAPDEFIRMTSPALYFRRTATRDARSTASRSRPETRCCSGSFPAITTRPCLPIRSSPIFAARPTATSPSARAARMCVWACGWRGWK